MDVLIEDEQKEALEFGFKDFLTDTFRLHTIPEKRKAMENLRKDIVLNVHDVSAIQNPILTDESDGLISTGNFKVLALDRSTSNPEIGTFYTFAIQPLREGKQTAVAIGIIANHAAQVLDEKLHFSEPEIEHVIQDFKIGDTSI